MVQCAQVATLAVFGGDFHIPSTVQVKCPNALDLTTCLTVQRTRRSDKGVTGEWKFFEKIEDPRSYLTSTFRQKDRLKMAKLLRHGQHLLATHPVAICENSEAVASVGLGRKNITMGEVEGLI